MPGKVTEPSVPAWANQRTAVVAESALAGCVAERGDRLYAGLIELLRVSRVTTLAELRAAAAVNDLLASFLEACEDDRAFELDESDGEVELDPDEDVKRQLVDWYVEVLPAPWIVDGETGWEIDGLIARFATASGASPGGHTDWVRFDIEVDELASHLRGLGFATVQVPARVFDQFFGFPVDALWLDEGEPLVDSEDAHE